MLAQELNTTLAPTVLGRMLSDLGQRLYFPKGIIAQSAEAKKTGKKANATIGMAVKNGKPLILPSIAKELPGLTQNDAVAYAPTAGLPELCKLWKEKIILKNPALKGKTFSLPVVTPGLTAGICYLCDLFLSEGDELLTGNPAWDNYPLIAETRRNAVLVPFRTFTETGFDTASFREAFMRQAGTGKVRMLLNFPQNPAGYSPTKEESQAIRDVILEAAESGADVMVWCDDAYFGLDYEASIEKQSLFAFLADIHERVAAVKIDGPTKEDYVWGFRTGFLTFAGKGLTQEQYDALAKKLTAAIRSSVSCSSTPVQAILLKAIQDPAIEGEKEAFRSILEQRYRKVRSFIDAKKGHPRLSPLPFNSGYFMCLKCSGISAEALRQKLLAEYGIGIIAIDDSHIRIAYSSIDTESVDQVYTAI